MPCARVVRRRHSIADEASRNDGALCFPRIVEAALLDDVAVRCVGARMSNTTSGEPASASAWHWHRQGSSHRHRRSLQSSSSLAAGSMLGLASLLPMNLESATTSVTLRTWTSAVDSGYPSSPRSWCCRPSWKYRRCRVRADRPPFALLHAAAEECAGLHCTAPHCATATAPHHRLPRCHLTQSKACAR